MLINKIDETQQQEGFIKDKQQILFDDKCQFNSIPYQLRKNPYLKKIKHTKISTIQQDDTIKFSPFINQRVRKQAVGQILEKHKQSIIFNGFNNQIAFYQSNITFDANFSMGNLEIVTRVKNCQYDLYMRPDTNTNTHFQWFYFKIKIIKKKAVKLTLKNFIKATMLYSKGLKPFYLSKKQQNEDKFTQIKQQVQFSEDAQSQYFNLSFTFNFRFDNDQVQFCSQPPYGLVHLQKTISQIPLCQRLILGKTVLGTKIPYLLFNQLPQTKVIGIVIARQHPGEVVGSWMMDGFLNQLKKGAFKKDIQWVVVPMVNIDGVRLGNNRTGVLGHDFNRNWNMEEYPKKDQMFPQVSAIISLIRKLKRKYPKKVKMFLDFHGHSSQQNIFTYGPPHIEKTQLFYMSKVFPQLLAKRNQNFKLQQSSAMIHHQKKSAARSVVLNQLKIPFTYTIECTFGVMNNKPITANEIIKVGEDIAISANQFLSNLYSKASTSPQNQFYQHIKQKYYNSEQKVNQYDSASEQSENTPRRKQFEMNLQSLLSDKSKRTQILKTQSFQQKIVRSLRKDSCCQQSNYLKPRYQKQQAFHSSISYNSSLITKNNKRLATQGYVPQIYNECAYFPPIKTHQKTEKLLGIAETKGMMNMKEIQERLFKLKNSRIGKKILVINAYGV